MIEFEFSEAQNSIDNVTYKIDRVENVYLTNANGRICAEKVIAKFDVPTFDISAMDGFALPDNGSNKDGYFIIDSYNEVYKKNYNKNFAIRVLTGLPVPEWAYCVVPDEFCEFVVTEDKVLGKNISKVFVKKVFSYKQNIRYRGEDIKKGEVVVDVGSKLNACSIAQLASVGFYKIKVYKKPVVILLSTGNELIRPPVVISKFREHQEYIRFESNTFMLNALLGDLGARVEIVSHLPDDANVIESYLSKLYNFDMIISTGGASNSEHDLMKPVFKKLGATFYFERVKIKPARPTALGIFKERPLICLPGNPFASYVSFIFFVAPLIKKILNVKHEFNNFFKANAKYVGKTITTDSRSFIIPIKVLSCEINNSILATDIEYAGSGVISIINKIDAFAVIKPNSILREGNLIELLCVPKNTIIK